MSTRIRDYFPYPSLQGSQGKVLDLVQQILDKDGYKYVVIQSPVGSGKSPMAIAMARYYRTSHLLTPRKQLQDQYFEDFSQHVVLMKGRGSYPCLYDSFSNTALCNKVHGDIINGRAKSPAEYGVISAADPTCPCCKIGMSDDDYREILNECNSRGMCPYDSASRVANDNNHIVHNLHGFLYQMSKAKKFNEREIMILDECHDLADTIRDYLSETVYLYHVADPSNIPDKSTLKTVDDWVEWLMLPANRPNQRKDPETGLTLYESYVVELEKSTSMKGSNFAVSVIPNPRDGITAIKFTPINIGGRVKELFLDHAERVVMMSGTIYDHNLFCRELGLDPKDVAFLDVKSTFDVETRPIVIDESLLVNTSHKTWYRNLPSLVDSIETLLDRHQGENGLIHAPSYAAAKQIELALASKYNVITHTSSNFQSRLELFYRSKGAVFLSPVCQQGVDFKYDRARFQIICRVPYLNAGDGVSAELVQKSFPWYHWRSLIVFGQQCGRVNRAPDDYGVTYLLDTRFKQFLSNSKRLLPKWFTDAIKIIK